MIHLIYVSSATEEMSEEELLVLLEQSRARNFKQQVTGMLLYAGGNFFQVLEGEAEDVEQIYQDILKDNRNGGNILIQQEEIAERTFPQWSMGFKYLSRIDIEGYTNFLDKEMTLEQIANQSNDIVDLLYEFKKNV